MRPFLVASCLLALAPAARAQSAADLQTLRDEIHQLRTQYESRIRALEAKLEAAQSQPVVASPAAAASVVASPVAAAVSPAAAAPAAPASSGGGFNPALSLILSGTYTRTTRDPATYRIAGFPLPPDGQAGPGTRGFSVGESELGLSASVDPWFSGFAALSFGADNNASVEEAYVQTTSLGNGFTAKAGRYLSSIGYLNSQHAHTWDFVDAPLAYQAMLGGQFADDGLQVAWIAPTDTFLEVRGEVGRGRGYPGTGSSRNGAGAAALSLHAGGDWGDSSSWRVGASVLNAKASSQSLLVLEPPFAPRQDAFTGSSRVWIADAVWKWAPNGNATQTNFKLQGEYLRSTRGGTMTVDPQGVAVSGPYSNTQSGWYVQAVYQFMRGWRVGLRTERLDAGTAAFAPGPSFFGAAGATPHKNSLMFDWSPSEFSRVRLQYARDLSRPGLPDNQLFLQYMMSLGAHGAHSY